MFLFTIDFLKNGVILTPLFFIIYIVVKRRLKIASEIVINPKLEDTCIPEVIYFESMSIEDKLKKLVNELRKIERCITTPEKMLNVSYKCLNEIQLLKIRICKTYQIEQVELNNAISWLEKSTTSRGKYKPVARDDEKIESHDINTMERVIKRLITKKTSDDVLRASTENSEDIVENVAEVDDSKMDETDGESDNVTSRIPAEAIETETIKIPGVNLEKILEVRQTFDRLLPVAQTWSLKLFDDMLETVKMVYVTFMVIRRSIFSQDSWKNTINPALSKLSKKLILIQTRVDDNDGVTSIDLSLFPTVLSSSSPPVSEGPTGYFARFTAAVKQMAVRLLGIRA
ncbi:uncharacterized protein LOC111042402 [Myzus persicae]|uniref:uncharacterized protein LOC111042402 n=1 Tax=Myzus persicae TaxID=13164 RepID=UPI000B93445B|nr:uncharacterized protein LOC111042402 [Myzus persicae]